MSLIYMLVSMGHYFLGHVVNPFHQDDEQAESEERTINAGLIHDMLVARREGHTLSTEILHTPLAEEA